MDYAHNEDGFLQISRFADNLDARGRKILLYAVSKEISDDMVREAAAVPAGHFDHYICKNYSTQEGREVWEVPALMRESLEASGVDAASITVIEDEDEALTHALSACERGDVLIVPDPDASHLKKPGRRLLPHEKKAPVETGALVFWLFLRQSSGFKPYSCHQKSARATMP